MLYPVMYRVSLEVVISASLLAYLQIRKSTFKVNLTYLLKTKTSAKDNQASLGFADASKTFHEHVNRTMVSAGTNKCAITLNTHFSTKT